MCIKKQIGTLIRYATNPIKTGNAKTFNMDMAPTVNTLHFLYSLQY